MLLTEKEAAEKWCPHVRFEGGFNSGTVDRMNLPADGEAFVPRCIGSGCMAWRNVGATVLTTVTTSFGEPGAGDWTRTGEPFAHADLPHVLCQEWSRPNPERRGYCGLAGKPEGK